MKWTFFLIILIAYSCSPNCDKTDTAESSQKEYCANDVLHTYEVYIPSHNLACGVMPVVILLDPKGSGNTSIKKFISAAENFKCIIVASNLVKNNLPDYMRQIDILIGDVKSKFKTDKIYLAGFSGGARMALNYASLNKVEGVISCGALASHAEINKINCNIFALAGLADFNFNEFIPFIFNKEDNPANLSLYVTEGIHEWPSSDDLEFALGNLILKNTEKPHKVVRKKYIENQKARLDTLISKRCFLSASLFCNSIISNENIENKYFLKKYEEIQQNSYLDIEKNNISKSLQFEAKVKQAYYNSFTAKDIEWWRSELSQLNKQIVNGGEKYSIFTFKRIKAFLGILCYSVSKTSLHENDMNTASKVLEIYKTVEPENTDMMFFTAVYEYKTGKTESGVSLLREAIKKGFNDFTLINQHFPDDIMNTHCRDQKRCKEVINNN